MTTIFIACLGTETNTFSPLPTGWANFEETMLYRGDATAHPPNLFSEPLHVWRRAAEAKGFDVVESIAAFAEPAGVTTRAVYESLRDELLGDLKAALPVDIVLICMHGAMVADGYLDCEGDILARIRDLVGPDAALGAELDLHCSITPAMTEAADALITFKEYPHIDGKERAAELFEVMLGKAEGRIRPVMSVHDCRMVNMWPTTAEPMASFVRRLKEAEGEPGILSVSFAHGFPWSDVPETTAKMLVVSDGDAARGAALARALGEEIWSLRGKTSAGYVSIDEGLGRIAASNAVPIVAADVSDNAGGGAPADATFVLRAVLDRGMTDVVLGLFWDPVAVRFCKEAGEGATFDLRLGGKCGPMSGEPVDLTVTVRGIIENARQSFGTAQSPIGDAVWIEAAGLDLVLNTVRTQTFNPDAFTQFGIDLARKKAVIVKSSQHFHAGFAPIASEVIYLATPGAITPDFANIPFERVAVPFWPKVEDPWAENA